MADLTNNPGYMAAPNFQPFPNGLDLNRCVVQHELGIFTADPAATFLQGMLVTKAAAGIQACAGKGVLGIAKWNKALTLFGANVDEQITLIVGTAVNLKKANVSNVRVAAAPAMGAALTVTTDYTVNAVNGTITGVAAGPSGVTTGLVVFVTYTYQLTASDFDFQGRNFWNFTDDVTIQDGRITVMTGWTIVFTTQFDTSRTYALSGAASNLYCSGGTGDTVGSGLFTNNANSANNEFVGRCIQLPTATDPYMGVAFGGQPQVQ